MEWTTGLYRDRRRKGRGSPPRSAEVLEARALLAGGIMATAGPALSGAPGVPLTNVLVASFVITDPSGSPGTKWNAQIKWGDGQVTKRVTPTAGPGGSFQFLGTHTYATANTFPITVMIAVPGSRMPNTNTVMTQAVIQPVASGSVSGVVFNDLNGDGMQEPGEPGLPGWTVNLLSGPTVVGSAVSGANGSYTITNVAAGTYTLAEVLMPGYTQTAPPPPGTYTVTVAVGQAVTGKNFGNVIPVLQSITVTPPNPSVALGFTQQFVATGTFSDHSNRPLTSQVTWMSSNTAAATISNAPGTQGLATAVGTGTSTITATLNGISGSTKLTVSAASLKSITLSPANPTVAKGGTQQFRATGTFSDGSTQDLTGQVVWASANPAIATINAAGLATGQAVGSTSITATARGVTGSTTLTVSPALLKAIVVLPTNATIAKGGTQQFTATGAFSDGTTQDLTGQVAWASSNPAVATINAAGLATGQAPGTVAITATLNGVTGASALTASPPPPKQFIKAEGFNFQATVFKTFFGLVARFSEPNTSKEDFHVTIDWGDHSLPKPGHINTLGGGRFEIVSQHRYVKTGVFPVTITIRDHARHTAVVQILGRVLGIAPAPAEHEG
jgi:hypothetical protein